MPNNQLSDERLREMLELCEKRNCTVCGEERQVIAKVGPFLIKEPCKNACAGGYVKRAEPKGLRP